MKQSNAHDIGMGHDCQWQLLPGHIVWCYNEIIKRISVPILCFSLSETFGWLL